MIKTAEREQDGQLRYSHVDNKGDIDRIYGGIRDDIDQARHRGDLNELYRRAGYVITLTYAPSWEKRFGEGAVELRREAEADFRRTVRLINAHARKLGTLADFDEAWGKMKSHHHH